MTWHCHRTVIDFVGRPRMIRPAREIRRLLVQVPVLRVGDWFAQSYEDVSRQ